MKRFLIKATIKIIIAVSLLVIAFAVIQSPVLSNEVAMGQMESSDGLYIAWSSYSPIVSLIQSILCGISGYVLGRSILDIYKFLKTK